MNSRIIAQVEKEWSEFKRDRLSLSLAFILPLMTLLLFGYGVRMESHDIPVLVQDNSKSSLSRAFIERIAGTNNLKPILWKEEASSIDGSIDGTGPSNLPKNSLQQKETEAKKMIDRGEAKAAIIIPQDLARDAARGKESKVKLFIDGTDIINARLIESTVKAATFFLARSIGLETGPMPVKSNNTIWFNPGLKESVFIIPGVFGVVFWMFPGLLACVATAREKEQGTIVQAYASSIKPEELILGKTIVYLLIGLVQAVLVMAVALLLFGVFPSAAPSALLVSIPIYVACSVLFGLAVGSWANSQTTAVQAVSTLGFFTCLLLSGFVYPLSNIPFPLSLVSYLVPARYFIEVSRAAFARGGGWAFIWYDPLILLLFVASLFTISWLAWRRKQFRN